jgi:hypothetical protein
VSPASSRLVNEKTTSVAVLVAFSRNAMAKIMAAAMASIRVSGNGLELEPGEVITEVFKPDSLWFTSSRYCPSFLRRRVLITPICPTYDDSPVIVIAFKTCWP